MRMTRLGYFSDGKQTRMRKRIQNWLAATCLLVGLSNPGTLFASPCPDHISAETWVDAFKAGQQTRADFLSQLRQCLPGSKETQEEIDYLAVEFLDALESIPDESQGPFAAFIALALLVNAEAGFAPSQHNYASIHNAAPGSLVQQTVPQDYATFIYWTRKAASQKEPRALFNLAVRLADSTPPEGLSQDLPTAYLILAFLQDLKDSGLPPPALAYASETRRKISKRLGTAQTRKLDASLASFDFSSLAATAPSR